MKKALSILLAVLIVSALIPGALATDSSGLQQLINNTAVGGTLELNANYTLTDTVTINKNITIVGNNFSVTGASGKHTFEIENEATNVTISNLTINASGDGYGILAYGKNLTLNNCTINAVKRGVTFWPTSNQGATFTLNDTFIYNSSITDYDNSAKYGDYRGISVSNLKGGTVDINGGGIFGFGYSINAVADDVAGVRDGANTQYYIDNAVIKGWTALNVWTANTDFTFTNCTLVGINSLEGEYNGFSTIKVNDGIYGNNQADASVIEFVGGSLTAVRIAGMAL